MPFHYQFKKLPLPEVRMGEKYKRGAEESTAGIIQGKKASDLEVRYSKSIQRAGKDFLFRERIVAPQTNLKANQRLTSALVNLPGVLEIDMLVLGTPIYPILIQGQISHFRTKWQADIDAEKKFKINEFGKQFGWHEAIDVNFWEISTQEQSDLHARNNLR